MPPNLGRIPIQTLACGALIVGSAVASGIVGGAALTTVIGTSLLGLVSGLATEVAGNEIVELAQQFRPSAEVLRNHDLTEAVRMAIAVVIKHAATNPEFHSYKKELDKLAQKAVKYYPAIADDADNIFDGIKEAQLPAIFSAKAEEFSQVTALDPESWVLLLDWLKAKEELVILPNPVIRHVANELHNTFPQALREVLKQDAAKDGKAFSGMMLLLLGEITADLRDLRTELNHKCDRILEEVQRLKAMPTDTPEVTQVFQQLLAQVQSGLSEELRAIAQQLTNELRETEKRIIAHQAQGFTQVQEKIEDVIKQVQQIVDRDSRSITVSGIIDSTRPSLNYWQGRNEEIEQIQGWLDAQNVNLIGIVASGGYGKSTLAAKIYDESPDFTDKFWVNVSQPLNFNLLGRELLRLLGYEADERMSDSQLAGELVTHLRDDGQYLLVIDNLESLLQPNGQWRDAAYLEFFNRWLSYGDHSVILVTTQEKPDLSEQNARWRRLDGLKPAEGAALLKEQGIQGSETELLDFAEQVEGHPLLLNLVIGFLRAEEGDKPPLSALRRENINLFDEIIGLHRGQPNLSVGKIFDASFDRLDNRLKKLLLNVSVYRLPSNAAAAAVMLLEAGEGEQDAHTIRQVEQDLRLLVRRSLLQEQRDTTGERRFRFQPLILEYVKQKAGDLTEAHERAIAYYLTTAKEEPWTTDDDLIAYFEAFHHRCELKQYDLAYDILDICYEFLKRRGYYLRLVRLYERLVQEWGNLAARKISLIWDGHGYG